MKTEQSELESRRGESAPLLTPYIMEQILKYGSVTVTDSGEIIAHPQTTYVIAYKPDQESAFDEQIVQTPQVHAILRMVYIHAIETDQRIMQQINLDDKKKTKENTILEEALEEVIRRGDKSLSYIIKWISNSVIKPLCEQYFLLAINSFWEFSKDPEKEEDEITAVLDALENFEVLDREVAEAIISSGFVYSYKFWEKFKKRYLFHKVSPLFVDKIAGHFFYSKFSSEKNIVMRSKINVGFASFLWFLNDQNAESEQDNLLVIGEMLEEYIDSDAHEDALDRIADIIIFANDFLDEELPNDRDHKIFPSSLERVFKSCFSTKNISIYELFRSYRYQYASDELQYRVHMNYIQRKSGGDYEF